MGPDIDSWKQTSSPAIHAAFGKKIDRWTLVYLHKCPLSDFTHFKFIFYVMPALMQLHLNLSYI